MQRGSCGSCSLGRLRSMVGVLREVFGQRLELSTSLEWGRAAQPFRSPVGECERSDVEIPCFTKNCMRYAKLDGLARWSAPGVCSCANRGDLIADCRTIQE
jgi:hypothetical protein